MDEQKAPSEEKDSVAPADGAVASEEMGSAEGDPLKPPEGASAGPEPESTDTKGPPETGSLPGRRCALCNCGDWSPHGQWELQRFEPVPDWPERLVGNNPPEGPGQPPPGSGQPPTEPELAGDDPAQIGFCEGVTPVQLFEPTGHCWVHRCCAAWAAGAGPEAAGVARAVFSGISQKCERCGRAGATIPCRAAAGCSRLYHFPCAAASGCFQSTKTLRLLCPEHVAEALEMEDVRCRVCAGPGDLRDLVLCTGCGQHFHGACLDTAPTPHGRSGWRCPECRACQTCRQPGQDSTMLVCGACGKGYHTFCVDPASQGLPTGSWKCKNCQVCSECGRCPVGLDPGCQGSAVCGGCQGGCTAADAPVAPGHSPQPESPAQTLEPPSCSELTDVPVPPPELEPVGGDEETQPLLDPKEAPLDPKEEPPEPKEAPLDPKEATPGDGGSPPGELTPVEVPPSEEPPCEQPLDEMPPDIQPLDVQPPNIQPPDVQPPNIQPPDVQPPDIQLPDVQPSEEPPPLVLPPEEPPSEELPLERPSLAELPPDRPPLEEVPPSERPPDELPLDIPPLNEPPPENPPLEKSPPHELPPEELPINESPPDELPPNELPLKSPPNELPLEELPPDELPPNEPPPDELPSGEPPPEVLPPEEPPPDKLSPEEPPPDELPPEEPLPSELPSEEDLKPPGLLPEVAVAEEAPALAPEVPPEEEMELELEPSLPPEMTPPPSAPPALRAISPVRPPDPSPDGKEDEVPEPPTPALPEPPGSPGTAMDTEPPGSPPPPLGSPVVTLAPTEPPEDEEMETAGGEGESPASPPGDAPPGSPAPELGPFPGLPEEEEEEEEEAPRLEREGTSGSSPPLSEEDAVEEGRAGGDPEAKGSPLLLEPEELGPETPMEVCTAGEKLLGRGDEGCPEPPALRPRPDILNEISNLSQGDTSSSFPGSEPLLGSPDPEGGGSLSPELGPASADASLQKEDGGSLPLGAETDDSLLFEPAAKGDGDKGRRRSSPGRSRVKQGRSSSFPGRRRPRGGSHGGRGRGRARLKSTTSSVDTLALADVESSPSKEEDEDDDDTMQNTVVLFSNTDKFVLMQDMCVVCGSFGRGAEGHLLACSQCSQCYHPYCVNSKITKVMLLKGWRCVECIVCEVCGKASDPSRLLLCDDCDISYHTYCLDPPLQTVPKGGWKCKWCVCCVQCGAASPGFHCEWQNNYTHCAPCASLVVCPFCREKYVEDDLLIQCRHCDRWLHAACDSLFTEEEVEQAADEGFDCSACQPYVIKPAPVPPAEMAKAKDPEPQYFRFEGVWLTETGMAVLRNLTLSPLHKRRQRKGRPGALNGDGGLEGGDPLGPEDKKDGDLDADELLKAEVGVEHMECEIKLEAPASPDRDVGADGDSGKGLEDPEECKKRKRKPYRPGIGGFMVRQRKSHTRLKKVPAVLADVGREGLSTEGHPEDGAPGDVPAEAGLDPGSGEGDEKKKRRGRKKSKLEDMFPPYLQEAFFGKALMDLSRKALLAAGGVGDGTARPSLGQGAPRPKGDPNLAGALQGAPPDRRETPTHPRGDDSTDGSAAAPDDDGKDDAKAEDLGADEPKDSPDPGDTEKPATPGEGALSSDLDKIPTEELPKMESKDVQQLFKDVLGSAERGEQPLNCVAGGMEAGQDPGRAQRPFLQGDLQLSGQGSVSLGSLSGSVSLDSYSGVCPSPFLDSRERSGFFSPDHCEPESPWASSSAATTPSTPTTPTTEGEGDGLSYNQRSLQRWEKDEELGELSTISPVLYANMNFPNLKQDYPDWSSRCKQIMKLWRKVPATDKAPYLQAESQINKQTKGEGLRKPERPSLHLRIPVPPGAQPVYISSPPAAGEGFLKPPAGAGAGPESPSELFLKLPPQSPAQVPSHDPYGAYALEPRFPSPLGQSPTAGAAFQPFPGQPQPLTAPRAPPDFHPTPPGTPRHQPGTPDPFLKPRCPSLDNLSMPGSPGARPPEALLSPLPFGEQKKGLEVKKEEGGSLGVCSPGYASAMGYGDSPGGPHLSAAELKAADVFKAPMTPRVSQVEPQSPGLGHRPPDPHPLAPSPPGHPDLYRQSPYLDPYSQPPLTPRLQPPEACCALPPRSLPSEPFSRVPASPQSQSSSQSPLTPRPLSNEAFCQSPVTPRFQSPDPYSQPPSRPQSRDPFTPLHKPPRPQMPEPGFKPGGGFGGAPAGEPHAKAPAGPQPPFARSPGASVFPGSQTPMRFTFPPAVSEPLKGSPSHQPHGINSHYGSGKPQSSAYASSPGFHQAGSPLGPGTAAPDTYSLSPLRPPSVLPPQPPAPPQQQDPSGAFLPRAALGPTADKREDSAVGLSAPPNRDLAELPGGQDGALGTMSQSELEKQRQRQRLRELLIRQQIQRNSLRQEKESAAAAATSSPAAWAPEAAGQGFELSRGMAPYQPAQDKGLLGTLATAAGAGKLPGSVMVQAAFPQDERLSRPPPAATPATLDINGRATVGPPQAFYPRGVFPAPSPQQQQHLWQQQQQQAAVAALRLPVTSRFAPPAAGTPMGSLGTRLPAPAEAVPPLSTTLGAPFIELRHNVQKGPGGVVGSPFAPQAPRPRFFLPGEEGTAQALCTPVVPMQALPPQKVPAPLPPASPQGAEMGSNHQQPHAKVAPPPLPAPTLELQHVPPRPLSSGTALRPEGPKDGPAPDPAPAPGKSHLSLEGARLPCEVPVEPDLDDDFGSHKDLEDDDDLANLSLDPDVAKGDDDLDNLDSLETADPHLDDLLNGDEFDLLAYTDPELDTGDKKDIFNEHLRLVESANEKAEREAQLKTEPPPPTLKLPNPGDSKDVTPSVENQEVPKEGLVPSASLGPSACSTGTVLAPDPAFKAQGAEAKPGSLPTEVKPKLEDGCLKTSPCQFTATGPERLPVPVKSEGLQGTDKISASLGLSLKPGQTLLSPGAGPARLGLTQFPNSGHAGVPVPDKDPYAAPGRGLAPAQLGSQSNPLLEKFELDSGALGLGSARHSPADDLDKMESSLVASELPLLIEDLLEHEKKELQKKQQMSAHLPRSTPHLPAPGHPMLHTGAAGQPPEGQPPRLGAPQTPLQLGLVARPPLMPPQPPRLGAPQQGPALTPHMGMASGQPHVLASPHGVQVALGQPQQSQQQVLVQKPMAGVQPPALGLKPPQLVMQQQLANSFFPDTDLDKFAAEDIMDPIAKAKMVALKGIKKVMAQGSIGVAPGMNRQQVSLLAQRLSGGPAVSEMQNHLLAGSGQERSGTDPTQARPNPPTFAQGVINEADQRQYEEWLFHTQQLLQMQLKVLEEQIGAHRKSRKALCAKQRTAKKAGREFPEADAEKLKLVTEQQSKIQKQLDQVRKQQKEHTNLMAEYRNKQQQHQHQASAVMALSPSQSPRLMSKLPGQLLSAHGVQQPGGAVVGAQGLGQQPGQPGGLRLSQGGVSMAVQQGLSFMGQQAMGNAPGPGSSSAFFAGNPALRGLAADSRLMQERQLQRMQLAQKLQQQNMLGQVSLPQQQQQQPGVMGQSSMQQPGVMGQVSLQQPGVMGQVPMQQQGVMGQTPMQQPGVMGQASMQQSGVMGQTSLQQSGVMGQTSLQQSGVMAQASMQQQGVMGQASMQQPGVMGQASLQQPGVMGQASLQQQGVMAQAAMQQPGVMGQTAMQQQGMMGQASMQQQGVMGQSSMQPQSIMAQTSMQQPGMMGQASMQQAGVMAQTSMQQPGMMSQASLQQPGALGQAPMQPTAVAGQPGLLGQQQQPPTPQPGVGAQPMVPKAGGLLGNQQSLLVQQLSPQQQPGVLGHAPAPGLQHQPMLGHPQPQRQVLLAPHQQRVLGSPQLAPQTPGMLSHRLVLSQQLGQSRALLTPQQQQQQQQNSAQPGLLGLGQGQASIQHFPQHGAGGQAPSVLHLSQGMQPAPAVLAAKDQPTGVDGSALPAEGGESGGQLHGEQQGPLNPQGLGGPEAVAPKHQAELGQGQQLLLASPQPGMLRAAPGQQGTLLAPPLQSPGAAHPELSQQHGDTAGVAEPPLGCGTGPAPGMVPAPRPPEQPGKGPAGTLQGQPQPPRLQSPGQHKAGPAPGTATLPPALLGQVPGPVMGQIRAQLQGVLAKNPQLRHLTPQQQQQLQALLVQRHQQSLLQQSQALRTPGPFPGQAPDYGSPAARQPPRPMGSLFQPRPGTPAEAQTSFAAEPGRALPGQPPQQPPQQPLAELVQAALAARGPQPGLVRLPTPPAPSPLGCAPQHVASPEQSPQEPKKTSPGVLASTPSPAVPTEPGLTPTPSAALPDPARGPWDPEAPGVDPADPNEIHINGAVPEGAPAAGEAPQVLVKQEPKEEAAAAAQCELDGDETAKPEANGDPGAGQANSLLAPGGRSEAGHLLLQKLLRAKNVQLSAQSPGELNGHTESRSAGMEPRPQPLLLDREDPSIARKPAPTKPKRVQKGNERIPASRKKLRKDEGLRPGEALMRQLKQELSLLPLTEPTITANFSLFAPFGSSPINGKSQLRGAFGSAVLDSVPDYYSQLLTKNNLSNPPTPPSSLPPTPPPSVQQKMVNGVTAPEELGEQPKDTDPAREPHGQKDAPAVEVKSLDLLAALPTPPHNQTEDVRMESDDESDSPDSIVPASSPESVLGEELLRFPLLSEAKPELEERVLSPIIPIIPRASIPVFPDTKPYEAAEPFGAPPGKVGAAGPGAPWEKGKSSEVSVMLTVSAAAAKNLNGVMVAMAELLSVKIPSSYEVLFPDGPVRVAVVEAKKVEADMAGMLGGKEKALAGKVPDSSSEWLKQFDAVLPGYSLKGELDLLTLLRQESSAPEKTLHHCYVNNVSNLDVRQLSVMPQEPSPPLSPSVPSPSSPAEPTRVPNPEVAHEAAPASPLPPAPSPAPQEEGAAGPHSPPRFKPRSRPPEDGDEARPRLKKWKGVRWKRLRFLVTIQKGGAKRDGDKEIAEFIDKLGTTLRPEKVPRDLRKCCFCHEEGDGATDGPARLLNLDLDLWVHLNCALWSTEVYETQGGALINVEVALHRGLLTKCSLCQKTGATNSCNRIRCPSVYHFACAIRAKCMFFKDKTMLCPLHKLKGPCEQELSSFTVFRRVYIERDEVKQIASIIQRGERLHMFRVGGLVFHAIGQLLPHQMADFHSVTALYPVGYEATRIYWSLRTNNRRCCYRCTICENNGRPEFVVQVIEQGLEDLVFSDSSPQAVWNRIIEPVAMMRKEADMLRLFPEYLKGEELFGLTVHAVLRIAESLPGVESCQNYLFRYGRHPLMELPLMINPTGCARSEPKILTHYKRPHTLNSTSMSKAYQSTFTGETNTPYSKQFVHSKSSQYRRLKTEWKNNVYLARSRIQGLGLYAAKDIEKHTMVIEYIGTIIRNEVANRREKIYEEQNRGIYMFRINNEHVIDATLTGGPARYINHSCAPNCVAEVVTFDKEDKIIIISSRRIPKGEELTYDYQFDFEDDQHKIPCHCGAWNCRKWMN
ncbi:histone-lysine N-methyltransferase 2D isoform X2 [Pipra filicauda]|uniref:Histone-lysine N-methyltransferase 2D n=1 Tax=Pipra filicauda TaxID=649802 RepID=A0A6J2H5U6_9PASS|nr:histone-lysine N-methyltransferase 2D isoform X2 [Pipra filicauda]